MTVPGYMAVHNHTRKLRGKAALQTCEFCGERAREWAYDHKTDDPTRLIDSLGRRYSPDPERYIALCKACHQAFDKSHITHCPHGHPYEGANLLIDAGKRKCRTCVYRRIREHRQRFGITPEQHAARMKSQRALRLRARLAHLDVLESLGGYGWRVELAPWRSRRRCGQCAGQSRASHVGTKDGVDPIFACELHIRQWAFAERAAA